MRSNCIAKKPDSLQFCRACETRTQEALRRPNQSTPSTSIPSVCSQPGAQIRFPSTRYERQFPPDHSFAPRTGGKWTRTIRQYELCSRLPVRRRHACDRKLVGGVQYKNLANSTYQFLLRSNNLRAHATDMGRVVLTPAHVRECGVSTPTVAIDKLVEALQTTVEHVLSLTSISPPTRV
jgi:hypothetical protein